jgi:hypothetical protein
MVEGMRSAFLSAFRNGVQPKGSSESQTVDEVFDSLVGAFGFDNSRVVS